MIDVDVRNLQRRHEVDRKGIVALAVRALRETGRQEAQISIAIVSDRRMREMNRDYRGRNDTTDVLAFSQVEGEGPGVHPEVLGDVIISADTAARQATEAGWSLGEEMGLLVVHGILHLAGFDHLKGAREKKEMEELTRKILEGSRQ